MKVDDPVLPATPYLLGPDAVDLLAAAVGAAGGTLEGAQLVQVQYRPGHDLVARYEAHVSWHGAEARRETLLAGLTGTGPFPGTLPMEAGDLTAGVWRYPFDPHLPGLPDATTPGRLATRVGALTGEVTTVEVKAYRPVRRAVVRVAGRAGEVYVKVVRPSRVADVVARHHLLAAAGLPVPEVLDVDDELGLVVMSALAGDSLRELLLAGTVGWPAPTAHRALLDRLATVALPPTGAPVDPVADAAHHARAIAAVLPSQRHRLDRIVAALGDRDVPSGPLVTAHGDYYEAQLVVAGDVIAGLLDLDDVGPADPLHDPATALAHLQLLRVPTRAHQRLLVGHRLRLRTELARGRDRAALDRRTAAVMVGLATGPFRAQSTSWRAEVRRRLQMAEHLLRR